MPSTFRTLAFLGLVGSLLGGVACLVALGLIAVGTSVQEILQCDERNGILEVDRKKIHEVMQSRNQITDELIDGKRSLVEVVSLYRRLNQMNEPKDSDYQNIIGLQELPEDEWLCLQIELHARSRVHLRSPEEVEEVVQSIRAQIAACRRQGGPLALAREEPPRIAQERKLRE